MISDASFLAAGQTFSQACAAAASAGLTLAVSSSWASVPTGSCAASVIGYTGGILHLAAGATLTLSGFSALSPTQQVFDTTATGSSVRFTAGAVSAPSVLWWGSTSASFQAALASSFTAGTGVFVPASMSLNEAITLGNLNQSVQCAPGAVLTFTGATNGFVISGNLHHSMQINNCTLATTNPRAGKAILLQANTTGVNLNNIIFRNSGSGAWTHGVYTTSVNIINNWTNLYCAGIAHCVYLQDQANATNIFNLAIDGTYNTGVEVDNSNSVLIEGGTFEGKPATALVKTTNNAFTTIHGAYFEMTGGAGVEISAGGAQDNLDSIMLGGGSVPGSAIVHAGGGPFTVNNLQGFVTAPKYIIESPGIAFNNGQRFTVSNSAVINTSPSATSHAIEAGTATTGFLSTTIRDSTIKSTGTPIVLGSPGTNAQSVTISGNLIESPGTYAIDSTNLGGFRVPSAIKDNTIRTSTVICNGCTYSNTAPDSFNVLVSSGALQNAVPDSAQIVSGLPKTAGKAMVIQLGKVYVVRDALAPAIGSAVVAGGTAFAAVMYSPTSNSWTVVGK